MADSEEAVSGEIFIQSRDHEEDEGTLDEPITTTLVSGVLDNGGTTCTTYLLTLPSLLPSPPLPFPSSVLPLSLLLPSPSSSLSPFSHFVHPLATISPPLPFSLHLVHIQARDMKAILHKFVHVLIPVRSNKALLHDCELASKYLLLYCSWYPLSLPPSALTSP